MRYKSIRKGGCKIVQPCNGLKLCKLKGKQFHSLCRFDTVIVKGEKRPPQKAEILLFTVDLRRERLQSCITTQNEDKVRIEKSKLLLKYS